MSTIHIYSLGETMRKTDHSQNMMLRTTTIATPEIFVHSGIPELDCVLNGFKAGEITYVDGDSKIISELPNRLCVNTYKTFHSTTIYIDGGICADPYQIARYARMQHLNQEEVLAHVQISRAFTVYQLSTFIERMLPEEIQRHHPLTLVIGKFPALYLDPDVAVKESQTLLHYTLSLLQDLTKTYQLITVLTNKTSRLYSPTMRTTVESFADEIIRMKDIEPCTYVDLVKGQQNTTILHLSQGQLRLEHFGLVM